MTDSKLSVTKAFKDVVFLEMAKDGFLQISPKRYFRSLDGEVAQFMFIYVENINRRVYSIEYTSLLLSEPHEFANLSLGGRFSKGSSGLSYGAVNEHMLEQSIARVLIAYKEEVRPLLDQAGTLSSFTQAYAQMVDGKHENSITGHDYFTLACAHSRNKQFETAKNYCGLAKSAYTKTFSENPRAQWALTGGEMTEQLLTAISQGTTDELHVTWKQFSIDVLKLGKQLPSKHQRP